MTCDTHLIRGSIWSRITRKVTSHDLLKIPSTPSGPCGNETKSEYPYSTVVD